MLDNTKYVPILKWKRAEQGALLNLAHEYKEIVTPLIEIVLPTPKEIENIAEYDEYALGNPGLDKVVFSIPKQIFEHWGTLPVFIDFSLIYPNNIKTYSVNEIISTGYERGLELIPVVNLNDDSRYQDLICSLHTSFNKGFCIRVTAIDIADSPSIISLNKKIEAFVAKHSLDYSSIDLVVDLKETTEPLTYIKLASSSQNITNIKKWRSFTLASGAFPPDLGECKSDEENYIERLDWKNWLKFSQKSNLQRIPIYSDYTIRHPIYDEQALKHHPTASLKYAMESNWLIMKGQKLKSEHYLAHANVLISQADLYYGETFSWGDSFILDKGKYFPEYVRIQKEDPTKAKGTGNAETWIKVGINHHISVVADQLSRQIERIKSPSLLVSEVPS